MRTLARKRGYRMAPTPPQMVRTPRPYSPNPYRYRYPYRYR